MRTIPTRTALFASLAIATQAALAANGTITFTGAISSPTCSVNADEHSTAISMANHDRTSLNANATATAILFSIALSDCAAEPGRVHTYFEPGAGVDVESGSLLTRGSGRGASLHIQLLDDEMNTIQLGDGSDHAQSSKLAMLESGDSRLSYYARYQRVGTAELSRGATPANVIYTITYN